MAKTQIQCNKCGRKEELNARFVAKAAGITLSGFGVWAWPTYFFAGTGLAAPICLALIVGGTSILAFSEQIGEWISKRYECPDCKSKDWFVTDK